MSPDLLVVGGGVAGLAAAWEAHRLGASFRLLEAERRFGGKVRTESDNGFVVEVGPDSFVERNATLRQLVEEVGLGDRLVPCRTGAARLSLVRSGRLVPLPAGLVAMAPRSATAFLRSPVLSVGGRLRFLCEPWVRPRDPALGDESVAEFVRRRFGSEALERLGEPVLAHIHVADPEKMSLAACYPRLAAMERSGGVLRAVASARRRARGGPPFWTLSGGMGQLVDAVRDRLPAETLVSDSAAETLEHRNGRWRVGTVRGEHEASAVVLAVPAANAAALLEGVAPDAAEELRRLRVASLGIVTLGFRRADVRHPLDGFGFFVPRSEGRAILACTWTSSKFDGRCASEQVLVRVFVAEPERRVEDTPGIVAAVLAELEQLLDVVGAPVLSRVHRVDDYPLYDVGHLDRVRAVEEALPPGLLLAGSALHGVGLGSVVESGRAAVRRLNESRPTRPSDPPAVPVGAHG